MHVCVWGGGERGGHLPQHPWHLGPPATPPTPFLPCWDSEPSLAIALRTTDHPWPQARLSLGEAEERGGAAEHVCWG